jgi:hypothetical protein
MEIFLLQMIPAKNTLIIGIEATVLISKTIQN